MSEINKETIESAMTKLENIVESLERDNINLEQAVSLYEQGMKLTDFCSNKLNEAKKRIDILVDKGGVVREKVPFISDKDNL